MGVIGRVSLPLRAKFWRDFPGRRLYIIFDLQLPCLLQICDRQNLRVTIMHILLFEWSFFGYDYTDSCRGG